MGKQNKNAVEQQPRVAVIPAPVVEVVAAPAVASRKGLTKQLADGRVVPLNMTNRAISGSFRNFTIFGFSACSVFRAIGAAKLPTQVARQLALKYCPEVGTQTVSLAVGHGKQGVKGKPAALSDAQWKEVNAIHTALHQQLQAAHAVAPAPAPAPVVAQVAAPVVVQKPKRAKKAA